MRSLPIKLRQILQAIGFLTPLDLVHALAVCNLNLSNAKKKLRKEGYSSNEINRVIIGAEKSILEILRNNEITVIATFYKLSRRYFLLDSIANFRKDITFHSKGNLLIPGYGEYYGAKASEILQHVKTIGGTYYNDWKAPQILAEDLEFLISKEWIINT